jgi:hypothetical protein
MHRQATRPDQIAQPEELIEMAPFLSRQVKNTAQFLPEGV